MEIELRPADLDFIPEAVELAKKYSGDDGPSFVNGVLAKLAD